MTQESVPKTVSIAAGVSLVPKTFQARHTYSPVSDTRTPLITRLPPSTSRYLKPRKEKE